MKAIKNIAMKKIIELPDDLMVMPICCNTDYFTGESVNVCHSDNTGEWFILIDMKNNPVDEITNYIFCCGTWTECAVYFNPNFIEAPFKWGIPLPSKHGNHIQYLPIWEHLPNGKFNEEDFEEHTEVYKLISMILPTFCKDNTFEFNNHTHFDITEYDNLIELTKDIENLTAIKF